MATCECVTSHESADRVEASKTRVQKQNTQWAPTLSGLKSAHKKEERRTKATPYTPAKGPQE